MLFLQEREPQNSHIAVRVGFTESKVSTDIDGQKWTYHLATSFI